LESTTTGFRFLLLSEKRWHGKAMAWQRAMARLTHALEQSVDDEASLQRLLLFARQPTFLRSTLAIAGKSGARSAIALFNATFPQGSIDPIYLLKNSPLCLLKRQNVGRSNKAWFSKRASLTKADLTKNDFIKFCQIMESRQ
jgi:hypothetical protein